MNIPIYNPKPELSVLEDEINEAIQQVLHHGQFILGPEVKEFENKAAQYLNVKHAIGVNSCTDALVIALRALGIKEGDEVITTSLSFFATAESISMVGATPVFIDIDERTYNINPENIEAAITTRTRAILPVHLFGLPANMTKIMELAENYDLKVIEDCAQSFGARYSADCIHCRGQECDAEISSQIKGKPTGSIGHCGTYSFFPTKNLGGIGDGGLIVTDNDEVARNAKMLRVHGADKKYNNELFGYNSRLDTIQAAVLLVKLNYIDTFNTKRCEVAVRYSQKLKKVEKLTLPPIVNGHVFHQYTVRVEVNNRDDLQQFLKAQDIQTNVYFPVPQNELPVYNKKLILKNSHQITRQVLSLPMWPHLTEQVQDRVAKAIFDFFSQ